VLLDIRANFVGLMTDARCDADGGLFAFHLLQETDPWMKLQTFGTRNDQFHPVSQCFSVGTMGTPENEDLWRSMRNDSSYNDVYH